MIRSLSLYSLYYIRTNHIIGIVTREAEEREDKDKERRGFIVQRKTATMKPSSSSSFSSSSFSSSSTSKKISLLVFFVFFFFFVGGTEGEIATRSPPSSPTSCDASKPPKNGAVGNCTSNLPRGHTCRPTCAEGFVLASSGKQSHCGSDGKLSYEAECVFDGCFVIEQNAAQVREPKPMNAVIVHADGKDEKIVRVSKDEKEIHVGVDLMRTRAKLISYANASTNNVVVSKRLIAGGESEEEIDVEKRLTELRKKAAELRERLLRVK